MALSDKDLINEYLLGNSLAFEELIYRYDRFVLLTALQFCGNEDDAKDIYQDVFIRVINGLPKFKFQSEFSTWLYKITVNVCLTHSSKLKRKREDYLPSIESDNEENNLSETFIADDGEYSPELNAENSDISEKIGNAINYLSPKERMCFILKHYSGYKIREISKMMKCKEGTIKKYLFDGVRKIRQQLKNYDFA